MINHLFYLVLLVRCVRIVRLQCSEESILTTENDHHSSFIYFVNKYDDERN